jgi:hypothetical protein
VGAVLDERTTVLLVSHIRLRLNPIFPEAKFAGWEPVRSLQAQVTYCLRTPRTDRAGNPDHEVPGGHYYRLAYGVTLSRRPARTPDPERGGAPPSAPPGPGTARPSPCHPGTAGTEPAQKKDRLVRFTRYRILAACLPGLIRPGLAGTAPSTRRSGPGCGSAHLGQTGVTSPACRGTVENPSTVGVPAGGRGNPGFLFPHRTPPIRGPTGLSGGYSTAIPR